MDMDASDRAAQTQTYQTLAARRRLSGPASSLTLALAPAPAPAPSSTSSTSSTSRRAANTNTNTNTDINTNTSTSANTARPAPASPEVISSLLDQLAAISASATNHLDKLPAGYASPPATPATASSPHAPSHYASSHYAGSHYAPSHYTASHYAHSRHASAASPYSSTVRPQHDLLGPDDVDACEPPVIRTSKPPSGRSPLTAPPKRKDKALSLSSYIGRSGSSASIRSAHSARSASSIGNVSIDLSASAAAAAAAAATAPSTRSSAESKRSFKGARGLLYMSSREQLRQREVERKRLDDPSAPDSPRKSSTQLFAYEDTIKEEPARDDYDLTSPRPAQCYPERTDSSRRIRLNLVDGPLDDTSIEQGLVPDRGSSLRHSASPSKKKKSRSSRSSQKERHAGDKSGKMESDEQRSRPDGTERSSRADSAEKSGKADSVEKSGKSNSAERTRRLDSAEKSSRLDRAGKSHTLDSLPEKKQHPESLHEKKFLVKRPSPEPRTASAPPPQTSKNVDSDAAIKEKLLKELEQEENEVAQRIRELREQKVRREKIAGKMPVDNDAAATLIVPRVSTLTAPELHPTSSLSTTSHEQSRDSARLYNSSGTPMEGPVQLSNDRHSDIFTERSHSRHRSLTWIDGDDFTLLPFNYALALKTLEESAPNSPLTPKFEPARITSPPPSSDSIDRTQSTRAAFTRSNSLSLVGRSVLGRKASVTSSLALTRGHRPSLSTTDVTLDDMMLSTRSVSEASARHSVRSFTSASNSYQNQQRRSTTKKKRWSHPDLPAKAEKAHNDKIDRLEKAEAVQRAQFPVVEERPVSQDSIGIDVDNYLDSPRLSQKIRHPQTGRVISFSEVGDPAGYAIFVCVGMGLTRFVMAFYDQLAVTLKLRLITPERPGIGASQADPNGTPLSWADDVLVICQTLKITKFSLLAHSAGAVYALATSLRMPQHIRGRVHLLAPWIPPSQMAPIGISQDSPPTQQLPRSQRFLRALPASFLKVANSTFLSGTSASLQRTGPKNTPKMKRKVSAPAVTSGTSTPPPRPTLKDNSRESMLAMDQIFPNASSLTLGVTNSRDPTFEQAKQEALSMAERERQHAFDERLTFAIWDRATANANPATDLIVCLETKQTIGFRYEDINRPVVIHHGSKDSRVPVDNVRWLGKLMRKCEVRILEGEQHGLMASAQVMGNVLTEMASEWDDWTSVVQQRSVSDLRSLARRRA